MKVLYITYDGLLDPLGSSQIIPYIKDISKHQENVIILSFEKQELFLDNGHCMFLDLRSFGIYWRPLLFTRKFGVVGKAWDFFRMYILAIFLTYKYDIQVVHARSHLSAQVALFIKKIFKKKFVFDFRGLWVDERVDKGGWDLNLLSHSIQYKYFKKVEHRLLSQADHVVVLTERVVDEVIKLGVISRSIITVIPCCADFNHFFLSSYIYKSRARSLIGIPPGDIIVLGYLGSVGDMYMLDRFFHFFELATHIYKGCCALLITKDVEILKKLMEKHLESELHNRVYIKSAEYDEVPVFLSAMDIMVSFIRPSYARMAASPTKIAECFSMGIPVIANSGIGDVSLNIDKLNAGCVVDPFLERDLINTINKLDKICLLSGRNLRNAARPLLGLEFANKKYKYVYEKI